MNITRFLFVLSLAVLSACSMSSTDNFSKKDGYEVIVPSNDDSLPESNVLKTISFGWALSEKVDKESLKLIKAPSGGAVSLGEDTSVYSLRKDFNELMDFFVVRISKNRIAIVNVFINEDNVSIFYSDLKEI